MGASGVTFQVFIEYFVGAYSVYCLSAIPEEIISAQSARILYVLICDIRCLRHTIILNCLTHSNILRINNSDLFERHGLTTSALRLQMLHTIPGCYGDKLSLRPQIRTRDV